MNAERIRGLIYIVKHDGYCPFSYNPLQQILTCPITPEECVMGSGCSRFRIRETRISDKVKAAKELLSTITNEDLLEILI